MDRRASRASSPGPSGAAFGSRRTASGACLPRYGIHTRALRLGLLAGYAAPPEPAREPEPERHLAVDHPGELVQMDAFCVGRLSGTKGTVWQYTAIDAASSFCWAELHVTPRNPDVRFASVLARRVAKELAACGWRLERVTSDHGSEFPQTTPSMRRWRGLAPSTR